MKMISMVAGALLLSTSAYASPITFDISGSSLTELHSPDPFYLDYFSAPGFTLKLSETLFNGGDYDVSYGPNLWNTEIGWQNLYGNPHVAAFYQQGQIVLTPHAGAVPEASTWAMALLGFGAIALSYKMRVPRRSLRLTTRTNKHT